MNKMKEKTGLQTCVEAFERLKAGSPHVKSHVGLSRERITAGIVSVEAGFDRGYLKKARPAHRALIAQIESYRDSAPAQNASQAVLLKRAVRKADLAREELSQMQERLSVVLIQNMQLVERVRFLELELKKSANLLRL